MKQTFTIILSSLLALYIVEAYLTGHGYYKKSHDLQEKINTFKNKTGENYDTRPFFQAYYELKKNANDLVPMIPMRESLEVDIKPYALSNGVSNSPTLFCNESGKYIKYLSDKYGFNNPNNQWNQKSVGYLLIGDSFTHGMCVEEKYTIPGNLRKVTNQAVLNLGNSGTGPLAQYATLREYFPLVNAKRIIWVYYEGNDLLNLDYELKNKTLVSYLIEQKYTQELSTKQKDIDVRYKNIIKNVIDKDQNQMEGLPSKMLPIQRFIKLVSLRIFIKNIYRPMKSQSLIDYNPNYEKYRDILKLVKTYTENNNVKLYFVYLPSYFRMATNRLEDKNLFGYQKVLDLTRSLEIDTIDLNKEFLNSSYDLKTLYPLKGSGHLNHKGYYEVTRSIYGFIEKNETKN